MKVLRTPDDRFVDLPGYPFDPHYATIAADDGTALRVHYVDEGPPAADPVLMLHGEPSWSYLYRKIIPVVASAGHRVVAPDLIGFGRSDKPAERSDYTYERHVAWMAALIAALDLRRITLLCQDWGGLIGLRLVAEHPDRFARVVAANTFLPTGDVRPPEMFFRWQQLSQSMPEFLAGQIVQLGCARGLGAEATAAYEAPFPDESYRAGARQFPLLVPSSPDDPATAANRRAWEVLSKWEKPFLTVFGDSDPITRGGDRALQAKIPGAAGQPHSTLAKVGHFIQEDAGEELAQIVAAFAGRGGD